jgi:hypothetical protein
VSARNYGTEEQNRCAAGSSLPDCRMPRHLIQYCSVIQPFFGQNWGAVGGSTGYLGMALDGKENANELHT